MTSDNRSSLHVAELKHVAVMLVTERSRLVSGSEGSVVSQGFDIVVSAVIAADELQQFLTSILPNSEVVVTQEEMEPPERLSAIWVRLMRTVDPDWPCMLGCFAFPEPSPLGERPDLRIAEYLAVRFGVKSLCDLGGLMPDLDPHDPYWSLAFAGGAWHLADTSGTPLMGPYTDGKTSFPGNEKVRLKQKLEL